MALINCPNCNQNVSDKAEFCPNCSYVFANNKKQLHNIIICAECGEKYNGELVACPKCGCPKPKLKKRYTKTAISIAVVLIISIFFVLGKGIKSYEYYENAKTAVSVMSEGAANAEKAGNSIIAVWGNSIYKKQDETTDKFTMSNGKFADDFNDALSALFSDEDFKKSINEIQENRNQVIELMRKLKNPPQKYDDIYSGIKELYENYSKFTKLVVNATGSYNSFSDNFNKYVADTADTYEKLLICFD